MCKRGGCSVLILKRPVKKKKKKRERKNEEERMVCGYSWKIRGNDFLLLFFFLFFLSGVGRVEGAGG